MRNIQLRTEDHSRDSAGMRYVYPVLSRRAGGISVGINLNTNNACNWRCVYCQVPGLVRGGPPPVDLAVLERELGEFLDTVLQGKPGAPSIPEGSRLADVAFSGNGEPTSAAEFPAAVEAVERVLAVRGLSGKLLLRLITNGSLLHRRSVQHGIGRIGGAPGEIWFKLDAATEAGIVRINRTRVRPDTVARRLAACAALAPTWVQTCLFSLDGALPSQTDLSAYLRFLEPFAGQLRGVHLYGLARPSLQPEAARLGRLDARHLEAVAEEIRRLGLPVQVSP